MRVRRAQRVDPGPQGGHRGGQPRRRLAGVPSPSRCCLDGGQVPGDVLDHLGVAQPGHLVGQQLGLLAQLPVLAVQLDEDRDLGPQHPRVERLGQVVDGARGVAAEGVLRLPSMAVRKMIGMSRVRSRRLMCAAVSKPSMPGIWTSSRITAKSSASSALSASSPGRGADQRLVERAEDRLEREQVLRPVVDEQDPRRLGLALG